MRIIKAFNSVITSMESVLVKGLHAFENIATMADNATEAMLKEQQIELQIELKKLKEELK